MLTTSIQLHSIGGEGPVVVDPAIEVERRKGFEHEARGYQLTLPDASSLDKRELITAIQKWAVSVSSKEGQVGIEFGGGMFASDNGELIIQGEFPPNKFGEDISSDQLRSLIESLKADLQKSGYTEITGGIRSYEMTTSIEGFIGLEPGYSGAKPHSFNEAIQIVDTAIELNELPQESLVFYNYRSGDEHTCCTETGIHISGNSRGDLDEEVRKIAAGLEQTSIHLVVGDATATPPKHIAWKIKGLDTAREAATARAQQAASPTHPHLIESELREVLGEYAAEGSLVDTAIQFIASSGHKDQVRDGGENTLTAHIFPITRDVFLAAKRLGWDDEKIKKAIITALCHDYLEDINPTAEGEKELRALFGNEIVDKVKRLSREDEVSYPIYYIQIAEDDICSLVKICDRDNNHRTDDAYGEVVRQNYRSETIRFILPIARALGEENLIHNLERHLLSHEPGKIRAYDPLAAAMLNGGCTFEPQTLGWWTFVPHEGVNDTRYGLKDQVIRDTGNGVFIPTITKTGNPVDAAIIDSLILECRNEGMGELSPACGLWCLSTDESVPPELRGTPQSESVWIARTNENVDQRKLFSLARKITELCEQDSVAYQVKGQLQFVSSDSTEQDFKEVTDDIEAEQSFDDFSQASSVAIQSDTLIVLAANDAEAFMVIDLARTLGIETVISEQPWGASWNKVNGAEGLEQENLSKIEKWKLEHPNGTIYGFELKGCPADVISIDGKTKAQPSSLLVLVDHLSEGLDKKLRLTTFQRLVAVNRAADPRSMNAELRNQKIDPDSPYGKGLKRLVTLMNRTCQAVSPSDEAQALRDLAGAERHGDKALVRYSTHIWTPQADRLFEDPEINEHMYIPANEKENRWVYYGSRTEDFLHLVTQAGLSPQDFWYREPSHGLGGYFGIINPSADLQTRALEVFWNGK